MSSSRRDSFHTQGTSDNHAPSHTRVRQGGRSQELAVYESAQTLTKKLSGLGVVGELGASTVDGDGVSDTMSRHRGFVEGISSGGLVTTARSRLGETIEDEEDVPASPSHKVVTEDKLKVIYSPYEKAKMRSRKLQLFDKRVYEVWWKRYQSSVPSFENVPKVQPFHEIVQRDYDVALGKQLGFDHPCLVKESLAETPECDLIRWKVYERRQREIEIKEMERLKQQHDLEKAEGQRQGILGRAVTPKICNSASLSWLGSGQLKTAENTIEAFRDYRAKKKMIKLQAKAKVRPRAASMVWAKMRDTGFRKKLLDHGRRMELVRKLRLMVTSVVWINLFCSWILRRVKGPYNIYRELQESLHGTQDWMKFDASNYANRFQIADDVLETLKQPWRARNRDDVELVIEGLAKVDAFIKMPDVLQSYVAKVGWHLSLQDNEVILRQGQRAEYFYIVLSGAVRLHELVGSPVVGEYSESRHIKTYGRYQLFGEEAVTQGRCYREYTAQAVSDTTLLAIPVLDYMMVGLDPDWHDDEPEHLALTRIIIDKMDLPFTKKSVNPKGNLIYYYFAAGSIITTSSRDSDWVYIVSAGHVSALTAMEPSIIVHLNNEAEAQKKTGKDSAQERLKDVMKRRFSREGIRTMVKELAATTTQNMPSNSAALGRTQSTHLTVHDLKVNVVKKRNKNLWDTMTDKQKKRFRDNRFSEHVRGLNEATAHGLHSRRQENQLRKSRSAADTYGLRQPSTSEERISQHADKNQSCSRDSSPEADCDENVDLKPQPYSAEVKPRITATLKYDKCPTRPNLPLSKTTPSEGNKHRYIMDDNKDNNSSLATKTCTEVWSLEQNASRDGERQRERVPGCTQADASANSVSSTVRPETQSGQARSGRNKSNLPSRHHPKRAIAQRAAHASLPRIQPINRTSQSRLQTKRSLAGARAQSANGNGISKKGQTTEVSGRIKSATSSIREQAKTDSMSIESEKHPCRDDNEFRPQKPQHKIQKTQKDRLRCEIPNCADLFQQNALDPNQACPRMFHTTDAGNENNSALIETTPLRSRTAAYKRKGAKVQKKDEEDYYRRLSRPITPPTIGKPSMKNKWETISNEPADQRDEEEDAFEEGDAELWSLGEGDGLFFDLDNLAGKSKAKKADVVVTRSKLTAMDSTAGEDARSKTADSKKESVAPSYQPSTERITTTKASKSIFKDGAHGTLKGVFDKGSPIGFEWLDLKDGKFRPPAEDYSLVSRGATVVMIKKKMLLSTYAMDSRFLPITAPLSTMSRTSTSTDRSAASRGSRSISMSLKSKKSSKPSDSLELVALLQKTLESGLSSNKFRTSLN